MENQSGLLLPMEEPGALLPAIHSSASRDCGPLYSCSKPGSPKAFPTNDHHALRDFQSEVN